MVKLILSSLLFMALAVLSSCRGEERASGVLRLADSLMEERPDSALALLEQSSWLFMYKDRDVRKAYVLSKSEAEDKCHVVHTSDSAMLPVVKYFDTHGTPLQRVRAWYVLGRVYCDLRLYGHALTAFDNAITVNAGGDPAVCRYKSRACMWAGDVYGRKGLHDKALRYNKRAYQFASKADVPLVEVYALRDIGRSYSGLNKNDMAISYYRSAAAKAKTLGDDTLYKMVMEELAAVYIDEGHLADARKALSTSPYSEIKENLAAHYFTWAKYYEAAGQLDSAMKYNLWGMDYGSGCINKEVCRDLARISLKQGRRDEAMRYYGMYFAYADSLKDGEAAEYANMLSRMERMLDVEQENTVLFDDKMRMANWLSVVVFAVMMASFFVVRYFVNVKKRMREQHERVKKYLYERDMHDARGIKRNKERIAQLESELSASNEKLTELQRQLIINETEMLNMRNEQIAFEEKHRELLVADFAETDVYKLYHDPMANPSPADYHKLVNALDKAYGNFSKRLKEFYPGISDTEIWICCMVKAGLSPKEICNISSYSFSSLSMAKSRLYGKMFNKKGSARELDAFVRDF